MSITRQEMSEMFEEIDEVQEVETDNDGYITRLRAWIGDKPVELYPATEDKIGIMVTD